MCHRSLLHVSYLPIQVLKTSLAYVGFKEKAFWVGKQKVCESGTTSFHLTAPLNTTILDMKHTVDLSEYHELSKIIEIIYIP